MFHLQITTNYRNDERENLWEGRGRKMDTTTMIEKKIYYTQ